ncbi:hypothetical protein HDU98_010881, partial [Podochytrium sp. JEL0797]
MVPNEDSATQCVACEITRVGGAAPANPSPFGDAKPASSGGFSFAPSAKPTAPAWGGFSFPAHTSAPKSSATPAAPAPGGFSFKPAETSAPAPKSTLGAKW